MKLLKLLTVTSLLLLTTTAFAASNLYRVELVIFSHINQAGMTSELWPSIVPTAVNDKIPLLSQQTLDNSNSVALSDVQNKINRYKGYKVLMHVAWQQPITSNNSIIHIYGGQAYNANGEVANQNIDGTTAFSSQYTWEINGTLTLNVNRYFDAKFNLVFAEPAASLSSFISDQSLTNVYQGFAYFSFNQKRRMRSSELNYMSHPLYGIFIEITPVSSANA